MMIKRRLEKVNKLFSSHYDRKYMTDIHQQEFEIDPISVYRWQRENMPKLERFYIDQKYKEELEEYNLEKLYHRENSELVNIRNLERLVKQKIGIPANAIIKYEKVKCSKTCIHDTHKYFYAYYQDSLSKKLKKKYIGKKLPFPISFKITMTI